MNSEMLGLSYLQIALGKTDHLVAHINSNDKEPSWDGDVEVYRKAGHVHAKADLILKVPVQVKGHCKPNLKKKSIKYSIQYADLKNYLAIGGTIFFVIYINDSGDKAAIYYVDLLPYDLKKHLKAYDGDPYKYKSIELKAFPKKKNDIADVFLNFTHHMNMQRASINSTPVTLESLCTSDPAQFSNIELTMGYSTTSRNYQFPFDYFFDHETYLYVKQPHDVTLPIAHLKNVETVNYTVNAPISVKSVVFYDHYTVSRTKNLSTINFGADIHQALQVGTQAKPDFHFSLSGSLSERIRDARFIIAVLNAQQYEINGGVLNFSGASSNSSGFIDVSSLQKQLDFLVGMQDTLNLLHVKKDLDPSLIDEAGQNCLNILKIALLDKKSVNMEANPNKTVRLGLFGGEPLLIENEKVIDKILQFCKEHKTTVHITTNGSFLSYYLKKFIINRRFISGIYPTIDSMALNYMTRYDLDPSRNNTNETFKLLCCIKTLLHYGIHVDLGTNIDRHNHKEIWNTLDDLKKLQLLQDKNFAWTIGRVDDRLYETNFPDIMMESEILAELQSKPLPDNVHAAFLKTCYNFADKMGLKLNLREHKQTHSYCWSTSSSSNVFYVDMNLKTYRCTCTVGRSRYSLFDFSYENLTNYRPVAVTCNSYAECKDCKIGGFCGGGCQLSHQIDFKKCCTYEEEVFSHFMKTLFIPYIKSKYNEVNQNERKAENRCT